MFAQSNGYSLSDIAAATGKDNRNGFGDEGWWIILLFLFAFGNGNGWNNNRNSGSIRDEIAYGFDINGLENGVRGIQQGLCDGFYAMNTGMLNGFTGVQNAMCQGFSGINNAITQSEINGMQNTFGLQNAITAGNTALTAQLNDMAAANAACCCNIERAIDKANCEINYNLATQACDTRRAITDSTRTIIDFLTQDKIATLTAENQSLKFAASQQAQNAYIVANQAAQTEELIRKLETPCPIPAYVVPNPNCGCGYRSVCGYENYCG